MNIIDWTNEEKQDLIKRGARWLVVVQYTRNAEDRKGDIVSWHKSHEAASRAARSQFLELRDIHYCDTEEVFAVLP